MPYNRIAERERAEEEVLDGRFVRAAVRPQVSREHVERHRHRLEADEEGDEVDPSGHEHHAERRAEDEKVVFARPDPFDGEIARGHRDRQGRGDEEQQLEEERKPVDRDEPARDGDGHAVGRQQRDGGGGQHRDGEPRQRSVPPPRQRDVEDEHQERAGRQHDLRQEIVEVRAREPRRHQRAPPSGFAGAAGSGPVVHGGISSIPGGPSGTATGAAVPQPGTVLAIAGA